jgi:CubicO group peptidase (beta-lactamase class C family)
MMKPPGKPPIARRGESHRVTRKPAPTADPCSDTPRRRITSAVLAAAFILIAPSFVLGQPGVHAASVTRIGPVAARIDSFLTLASRKGLSGAVLVALRDTVILYAGYGMANRETGRLVSRTDPFFVGSVAKQFTAAAVVRLAADGALTLTDSVERFFPSAPQGVRSVTVDQLLSHSSGLPYLPTRGLFGQGTRDSVMREMLNEPLGFSPGSKYEYSSVGYVLLAGIIERASNLTYEQYVSTKLFRPARLLETGFIGDTMRWRTADIRSYSDDISEGSLGDVPPFPRSVGAGSIVTTVSDLYKWYRALIGLSVLPAEWTAKLFEARLPIRPGTTAGYAWTLVTLPTGRLRLAAGDIGGYNAELRHYVDEGLIVVFASNRRVGGRGDREIAANAIARISRGEAVPPPAP